MNILFASSESVPFIKTGGLADVAFSLPKELRKQGIDIRVVMPNYKSIPIEFKNKMKLIKTINVPVGWRNQYCELLYMEYEDIPYYFIDNEYYFDRDGSIYGHFDDAERFSFFDMAVLEIIKYIDYKPNIIHSNDWHSGMINTFLRTHYKDMKGYKDIKTVYTIHNLMYQGIFSKDVLGDVLGLGDEHYDVDSLEFYGGVSFMKGGINYSDIITTVSETYSFEIQTEYYGEKLDGFLRKKNENLYGVINGIDYDIYNPQNDAHIYSNYNVDTLERKSENKLRLQEKLNLPVNIEIPLVGMVSRIENMKGFDLVVRILDELLSYSNIQMVILGTGNSHLENLLMEIAKKHKNKLSVSIMFDNDLAHKIYAGCDMFLMPSAFEPCGLSQLIALRYGSIPIVRETGGLKDTVFSYNELTNEGNGFSFTNYNAHDMLYTIKRAIYFYSNKKIWNKIIVNAMIRDYSWKTSASKYTELYKKLID